MIVFISDLHIGDHTVATFNLPKRAFTGVFEDLDRHLCNSREKQLELVLLGDIFELTQTSHWMRVPENEAPWGEEPTESHVVALLKAIFKGNENEEILKLFQGDLTRHFRCAKLQEAKLSYVPGNHDRLCNMYCSTRRMVRCALGLCDSEAQFDWHFFDERHRVFARHGHQYDPWNYGGGSALTAEAHREAPIGDVITAMLAARLPGEVRKALENEMPQEDLNRVCYNFSAMFDIRPMAAMIPWVFYQVQSLQKPACQELVEEAIQQTVRDFQAIPFVREWTMGNSWRGTALSALLYILDKYDVLKLGRSRGAVEWLLQFLGSSGADPYGRAAQKELTRLQQCQGTSSTQYVVYGHTHAPKQVPLSSDTNRDPPRDNLYLNTGTWRPRYEETADRQGFVGMKGLTYTIIYAPEADHAPENPHLVEAWTGMLKDKDVQTRRVRAQAPPSAPQARFDHACARR